MKTTRTCIRTSIRRSGFTLIELLIVLGIILAIAAMVVPNLIGQQEDANIRQTQINIANLEGMAKMYAAKNKGTYPQTTEQLMMPPVVDGRQMQPITDTIPNDAWGRPLYYEYPNTKKNTMIGPAIWSAGPNAENENGGGDDINNWDARGNLPNS